MSTPHEPLGRPTETIEIQNLVIERFCVGRHRVNTYLVATAARRSAILIDPGAEAPTLQAGVRAMGACLHTIALTHAHWDHVGAAQELSDMFEIPVYVQSRDRPLLRLAPVYALRVDGVRFRAPSRVITWDEHASIDIGDGHQLEMRAAPGHTPGGAVLGLGPVVFTGDTLLNRSVGRTDLPGGSRQALDQSLEDLAGRLTTAVWVCPGHGAPWPARDAIEWLASRSPSETHTIHDDA